MTTPRGSHNAVVSSSPRDDDEVLRDDPKLRAMRAVWLTMRDEDPPDRGLSELLAAARRTAEAMHAHPTLWQRLVAGLRRPPALALATVMVLLGGAVVLGRRGVGELAPAHAPAVAGEAETPSSPAPVSPPASAGAPAPASTKPAPAIERPGAADLPVTASLPDGSAQAGRVDEHTRSGPGPARMAPASGSAGPGAASAQVAAEGEGSRLGAVPVKVAVPREVLGKFARGIVPVSDEQAPVDPATVDGGWKAADSRARGKAEPTLQRGPPPPLSPSAAAGSAQLSDPAAAGASDDADGVSSTAHAAPAEAAEAEKKADRVEAGTTPQDKQVARPAATLAQLSQQCESAARRGDCAAVRLLVERITKSDRGYRARITKGSPVAKCLAE